jgi:hypothetical protein
MSPLRTIYRVVVMVAAGVIVVKGWQLYGPPAEKVKAFAVSTLEKAQAAWSNNSQQTPPAAVENDPRPQTAPLIATDPTAAGSSAPALAARGEMIAAPELQPASPLPADPPIAPATESVTAKLESNRLPQLLARLEEIGGAKPELDEWGSSGNLYRCSCRAHLADSAFARHFEAVAEEPVAAVEQVVAGVEAWQAEQQKLSP